MPTCVVEQHVIPLVRGDVGEEGGDVAGDDLRVVRVAGQQGSGRRNGQGVDVAAEEGKRKREIENLFYCKKMLKICFFVKKMLKIYCFVKKCWKSVFCKKCWKSVFCKKMLEGNDR